MTKRLHPEKFNEAFEHLKQGKTVRKIADDLGVSANWVANRRRELIAKNEIAKEWRGVRLNRSPFTQDAPLPALPSAEASQITLIGFDVKRSETVKLLSNLQKLYPPRPVLVVSHAGEINA